ncbi:MAG: FAD/NAD(P)-binding protein [Patescibacteria group bacterium]
MPSLQLAKIISVKQESVDTKLFRFVFIDKKIRREFDFLSGQFIQIGLAGWGECPISICSSPKDAKKFFELGIRDAGALTHRLHQLGKGDEVCIRGPFGNGFDYDKFTDKPLVIIGGGCGFLPLRPLINDYLSSGLKSKSLQIFYGCRDEKTLLFRNEYAAWNRKAELKIILEKPSKNWRGEKGLVTKLIEKAEIDPASVAILVGPPAMYRFAIAELKKKKIKDENIYLSLERKMYCGMGVCQHCAIGSYYVCKDGPVFSWKQIKNIPEVI